MTGYFRLDWAIMAVSFFNTILLLWLGLTVLLNADRRRSRGVWLCTTGLLIGGAFFFCHSIILGDGLNNLIPPSYVWSQFRPEASKHY